MQQGTLHSCREEPATGLGSGKGNTQGAGVPTTPAHGHSSRLPNLNHAFSSSRTLPQAQEGRTLLNSSHGLPVICALENLLPRPEPTGLLTSFKQATPKAWEG